MTVGFAGPAGAKLFTVNFDGDLLNELDGSDDVPFSFTGSSGIDNGCGAGVVCGEIRAVDVFVDQTLLQATFAKYVDFGAAGRNINRTINMAPRSDRSTTRDQSNMLSESTCTRTDRGS